VRRGCHTCLNFESHIRRCGWWLNRAEEAVSVSMVLRTAVIWGGGIQLTSETIFHGKGNGIHATRGTHDGGRQKVEVHPEWRTVVSLRVLHL
jgi:hypothetical protein